MDLGVFALDIYRKKACFWSVLSNNVQQQQPAVREAVLGKKLSVMGKRELAL